ncbi:MAG: bifunctional DNA primase/helicase, partial [Bacteroidota bacterium]
TAQIPKNLLRSLGYRFKHITLLYDADETGIKSMARLVREYKDFGLKSLLLPLSGQKSEKDVSDFFRLGNSADDLMMLFREMLDELYQETIAVMRICAINFDNPPPAPDPLLSVGEVTIGSPGNLVCIAGSEGSGKTNYLGGILSGAIRPGGIEIDTLGATVRENIGDHAVLLYDTEQSEYQLYKNLTYILKRSSLERPPDWFKAYSLVSISRSERMNLILESMDRHYYEHGGIHLVIIDGIADLLGGVNDEEPSVQLVEELFRIAAIYNT